MKIKTKKYEPEIVDFVDEKDLDESLSGLIYSAARSDYERWLYATDDGFYYPIDLTDLDDEWLEKFAQNSNTSSYERFRAVRISAASCLQFRLPKKVVERNKFAVYFSA